MADSGSSIVFVTLNDKEVTVVLLMMYLAITVLGLLALFLNAIVLDTLVKRTSLEATDLLMCHLAVTDMLTGILILHTAVYSLVNFQNEIECVVRLGAVFIFVNCSIYHLLLLTLDRFIKIAFPYLHQEIINRRSVAMMSCAVWILAINYGLLPLYGWRNRPNPSEPPCSLLGILTTGYVLSGLILVLLPFLVMSALYFKIYLIAGKHSRAITALNVCARGSSADTRTTMKRTKMVVILVGTYFVSFAPMAMVAMVYTVEGFHGMSAADVGDYIVYTSVLTFANSVVNPIIYAFKLPPVRKRFLRFIGKTRTTAANTSVNDRGPTAVTQID